MNLPNILTSARIILIPVYVYVWFSSLFADTYTRFIVAAVVFAIASLTDFLDGRIARKKGIVTSFGKIADPIADKLLTLSAYFCIYVHLKPGRMNAEYIVGLVFVAIIIARELVVTIMRMNYLKRGIALSAGISGKIKTVTQMLLLITAMLFIYSNEKSYSFVGSNTLGILPSINILVCIIMILTIWSGIRTIVAAKKH